MNNKKSMAFNEFLGLVLALTLLFVFIIYPGSKLYSAYSKQQYTNSYNNLVATIENIADSELYGWKCSTKLTDLTKEKNFFETRVTEYQSAGNLSWD